MDETETVFPYEYKREKVNNALWDCDFENLCLYKSFPKIDVSRIDGGSRAMGGETLCAPSLCASLVICLSLHFVVGVGHVAVGEWYHGGYTLCAAALLSVMWLWFVASCCGGVQGTSL